MREPALIERSFQSEEYIRWVQRSLNQLLGLRLPVTGVMEPATRSAIRSFQRQQGLAVSGIASPETKEALKAACGGQRAAIEDVELPVTGIGDPQVQAALKARGNGFSQQTEEDRELESTVPRPALIAWLTWQPKNENPRIYSWPEVMADMTGPEDVGVYIAVRFEEKVVRGRLIRTAKEILKVGEASRETFSSRVNQRDHRKMGEEIRRRQSTSPNNLGYFLAKIAASNACPAGGCADIVEHLIARTLYRAGVSMRYHAKPYVLVKATGDIRVENILPKQMGRLLQSAYTPDRTKDPKRQTIGPVLVPADLGSTPDQLFLQTGTVWELEDNRRYP